MNGFIQSSLSFVSVFRRFMRRASFEQVFSSKNIWKHRSWTKLSQFIRQTSANQTHDALTCFGPLSKNTIYISMLHIMNLRWEIFWFLFWHAKFMHCEVKPNTKSVLITIEVKLRLVEQQQWSLHKMWKWRKIENWLLLIRENVLDFTPDGGCQFLQFNQ